MVTVVLLSKRFATNSVSFSRNTLHLNGILKTFVIWNFPACSKFYLCYFVFVSLFLLLSLPCLLYFLVMEKNDR